MSHSTEPLFTPFISPNLTLTNRIVMAPMTRNFSPDGIPGPDVAGYYQRRAAGGVGLIITEGTAINHPAAVDNPGVPHFYGEEALNGWKNVVEAVHNAGGKIMPQLWHVGMTRKPGSLPNPEAPPVGPSGLTKPGEQVSEPLSESEIAELIAAYAQGATDAKRLGFDGIEIHGAHGYLIDQFFWEDTNQRTDKYGGDFVGRTRFAVEVIEACRHAVGPDFPIILRYSQWKGQDFTARLTSTPEELEQFLAPLTAAGVDIFHGSTRRFWEPEFEGSDLNLAGWTKKLTGKPSITVGSVGLNEDFLAAFTEGKSAQNVGVSRLVEMVAQHEVDLVAIGRALLVDPEWPNKIRDNRTEELVPFTVEALQVLS